MPPCWAIITPAAFPRGSAANAPNAGALVLTGYRPPNCYPNPAPSGVFCARCLSVFTSHSLWGYSLRRRQFFVFGMGGIQAADPPRRRIRPPMFTRLSERFAGERRKTPPIIYFKSPPQPVTRGAGAAPPAPSKTHRGHWAGVRGPRPVGRVAFVMTFCPSTVANAHLRKLRGPWPDRVKRHSGAGSRRTSRAARPTAGKRGQGACFLQTTQR